MANKKIPEARAAVYALRAKSTTPAQREELAVRFQQATGWRREVVISRLFSTPVQLDDAKPSQLSGLIYLKEEAKQEFTRRGR